MTSEGSMASVARKEEQHDDGAEFRLIESLESKGEEKKAVAHDSCRTECDIDNDFGRADGDLDDDFDRAEGDLDDENDRADGDLDDDFGMAEGDLDHDDICRAEGDLDHDDFDTAEGELDDIGREGDLDFAEETPNKHPSDGEEGFLDHAFEDSDDDPLRGEAMLLAQFFNAKDADCRSHSGFGGYGSASDGCQSGMDDGVSPADGFLPVDENDLKLLRDAVARGELVAPDGEEENETMGEGFAEEVLTGAVAESDKQVVDDRRKEDKLDGPALKNAVRAFIIRFNLAETSRKLLHNQRAEMQRELIKFDPSNDEAVDEFGIDAAFESFARDTMEISRQLHEYPPEVSEFAVKWNLSDESAQMLESYPAAVRKRIIEGFTHNDARNSADHNFKKTCRTAAMAAFCDQWKLDRISRDRFLSAVSRAQDEIMRKFDPKDEASDSVNKIFTVFANKLISRFDRPHRSYSRRKRSSSMQRKTMYRERKKFIAKWKLDEFSRVIFAAMPDRKVEEIVRDFGPRCHDKSKNASPILDANPIFVSFVKSRDPRTLSEVTRGVRDGTVFVDQRFRRGHTRESTDYPAERAVAKRRIKDFCKKWKLQEECADALLQCTALVQSQVMQLFDPVDKYANRNKVFMNFLRARKGDNISVPVFVKKFGLDKESEKLLRSLDFSTLSTVLRNFAPREQGRNQNPVFMSFTHGLQKKNSEMLKKTRDVDRVLNDFIKKYDLNYDAREQLRLYAPSSQLRLIQDFRPREPKHGVHSASKVFISYAKSRHDSLLKYSATQPAPEQAMDVTDRRNSDTRRWQNDKPAGSKRPREQTPRGRSMSAHDDKRRDDKRQTLGRADVPIPRNYNRASHTAHLSQVPRQTNLPWSPSPSPRRKKDRSSKHEVLDVKRPYEGRMGRHDKHRSPRDDRIRGPIRDNDKRHHDRIDSTRNDSYQRNDRMGRNGDRPRERTHDESHTSRMDGRRPSEERQETGRPFDARVEKKLEKTRGDFLQKWKLDGRADEYLSSKSPDIQLHVMKNYLPREFLPQDRLSPLFMNFVKGVSDNWVSIKQGHGTSRARSRSTRRWEAKDANRSSGYPRTWISENKLQGRNIGLTREDAIAKYVRRVGMNKSSKKLMESLSPRSQETVMDYFDPKGHTDVDDAFARFYHSRMRDAPERSRRQPRSSSNIPPPTRY